MKSAAVLEVFRLNADELDVAARGIVVGIVASAIARSAFVRPATWPLAIVIVRAEEKRVTSRADFAHWARANDLPDVAITCVRAHVRRGEILMWLDVDVPSVAAAGFVVIPLVRLLSLDGRA